MKAIEVREIARLVDLVYVCLLRREVDVLANLVANIAEEGIVDEILDYCVLVTVRSIRHSGMGVWELAHTVAMRRSNLYIPRVLCCRRDRCGSSFAPRRRR